MSSRNNLQRPPRPFLESRIHCAFPGSARVTVNPPARGGTAVTSALATALYMAAAAAPNAKDLSSGDDRFKSCCLLPLFQSNDLDEHVSRTPLHVTLGLGTNYLKAVEARCAELDSVWAINVTDQVLTDEWLTAVTDVEMAKEAVAECERNLRSKEAGMAIILEKDAEGSDPRAGYLFQRSSVPPRSPLHYQLENGGGYNCKGSRSSTSVCCVELEEGRESASRPARGTRSSRCSSPTKRANTTRTNRRRPAHGRTIISHNHGARSTRALSKRTTARLQRCWRARGGQNKAHAHT